MIPFRILFAALLTLLIIFYKTDAILSNTRRGAKVVIMCAVYAATGYFWISSLFIDSTTSLCRFVSILAAVVSFIIGYFVNFYSSSELANELTDEQFNNSLIGKTGVVLDAVDGYYVGRLDDGNSIMFKEIVGTNFNADDKFKVVSVIDRTIWAEKV